MASARRLLRLFIALAIAIIAFTLVKILVDGWDEILASYQSIDYRFLVASFLLGQLNITCLMLLWWHLLKQVSGGAGLSLRAAARIFCLGLDGALSTRSNLDGRRQSLFG